MTLPLTTFRNSVYYGRPIGQAIMYGYYLSIFFFPAPILSGRKVDVYHTSTHDVVLVRI